MMKPALFATLAFAALATTGAEAQQRQAETTRKVLAERVCKDGSTTVVAATGEFIVLEYFSAPRPNGTVSAYEDVFDRADIQSARLQFQATRCPQTQ